jgi:hypothetical protein
MPNYTVSTSAVSYGNLTEHSLTTRRIPHVLRFSEAKQLMSKAITASKMSALAPFVDRLALTDSYTNYPYPPYGWIDAQEPVFPSLLLHYAVGGQAFEDFPRTLLCFEGFEPDSDPPVPIFTLQQNPEYESLSVVQYRRVRYDIETIKSAIMPTSPQSTEAQ